MESFSCNKCEGTIDVRVAFMVCGTCSKIPEEALSIGESIIFIGFADPVNLGCWII